MIMSDGTSWSGGAVGVQGTNCINDTGGYSTAANVTFKFWLGAAMSTLNSQYGAGNWTITNAQLSFQYTLYANNSRFNAGAGTFDIYWVANNDWYQGTTNPIYATSAAALAAWSGGQSLIGSEYYPWSTPWYTGTDSDLTKSGVWVTDKTGVRQSTNYYNLTQDPSFVGNITTATATTNAYLSLYLMATDQTIGLCIFTGGASYLPTLTFQVTPTPLAITTQPLAQTVLAGSNVTFAVAATGAGPLAYQWYFDGSAISGATATNYSFTAVDPTFDGDYSVVITNAYGSITSSVAALTVNETSSLALGASANPAAYQAGVAFTASITPPDATGTIQFLTNGVVFDTETVVGGAATSVALVTVPVGTNEIEADYSGDSVYLPSTNTIEEVVGLAPTITAQPVGLTLANLASASFGVTATGTGPLAYQWYLGANALTGATAASFSIASVSPTNAGAYSVVVTNLFGSATSAVATLTVTAPPVIVLAPTIQALAAGATVNLAVGVAGSGPFAYQWFKEGRFLAGATNNALVLANASVTNSGSYYVVTTNGYGMVISQPAMVAVGSPSMMAWGRDNFYQLGDGSTTTETRPEVAVNNVVEASAGGYYWTLLVKSDSSLWAVGYNVYGMLGDGTTTTRSAPVAIASGVANVSAGYEHSLFLKNDSSLWAMGYNNYSQLGNGNTTTEKSPVLVSSNVVAIAAGTYHSLFIKSDGTLWAFGRNNYGQLGDGTTTTRSTPVLVAANVVSVAGGVYHSAFLKSDGTLWTMGYNNYGQIGNGTTVNQTTPARIASNVAVVSAGYYHTLFVKNDSSLWAVGYNGYGQLGDGTTTSQYTPEYVATNVVTALAAYDQSLFAQNDGTLWSMGYNVYGQLGDGTTTTRYTPVPVVGMSLANIVSGNYATHTLAIGQAATPTILTQPLSHTIAPGSNITFTVAATVTPLTYQWCFNGTPLANGTGIAGATSTTLALSALTAAEAGNYTVVVSDSQGSVTSSVAGLTIGQFPPVISAQPSSLEVSNTLPASFGVTASGTESLIYQWYLNGSPVSGATAATYALSSAATNQAGNYAVVITNWFGSVTSSVANLTVGFPPYITVQPAGLILSNNATANFAVTGVGIRPAYQWYFNNSAIAGATAPSYSLDAISSANNGNYTVSITTDYGNVTSQVASLTVGEFVPTIVTQPVGGTVINGRAANFNVTPTGTAPLSCQWYFNGNPISGATSTNYGMASVTSANGGDYTVVVTNLYGGVTSSVATLSVVYVPTVATQLTNEILEAGSTVLLSPTVAGTAPFNYQWIKDGRLLVGQTNTVLTITNAQLTDSGAYYVAITNAYGMALSRISLVSVAHPRLLGMGREFGNSDWPLVADTNVVSGAAGWGYVLAIHSDGTLWGMGDNTYDVLGNSGITNSTGWTFISSNVVAASGGWWTSYYVKSDSSLWTGSGGLVDTNVVQVSGNVYFWLKEDGTFVFNGTPFDSNVFSMAAGGQDINQWDFALYIKGDRSLYGAGYNNNSCLGGAAWDQTTPYLLATNVVQAAAGVFHSIWLTANGSVYGVGQNNNGQLGSTSPLITNVLAIAAGNYQSLYIKNDHSVWTEGDNEYGELGDGNMASMSSVPVNVSQITGANIACGSRGFDTLVFGTPNPVQITNQPSSEAVLADSQAGFTVAATGFQPMTYQWYLDGVALNGATATNYLIADATLDLAGNYTVVVSNYVGMVTSVVAVLSVDVPSTLSLTSSLNPSGYKAGLVFAASVTPSDATGSVQFLTNGVLFDTEALSGGVANSATLDSLLAGTNLVVAIYSGDANYWTSTNRLSQVVTNRVLTITGSAPKADGNFGLSFAGVPGDAYLLETTTNLATSVWLPIFTNVADGSGRLQFEDNNATNYPARFYRIQQQ
jgi:alpha-tubulin suppressor-like RCC1 family protein